MSIIQSLVVSVAFTAASLASVAVFAQPAMDHSKMGDTKMDMSKDLSKDMTEGEVRKVDKTSGKLTIKHGDIKNLNMPGMTMAFAVKNKALLDKVKTGDKIKFTVVMEGSNMVVTDLQKSK
jgi:Cu(I)/Ag(I) efflux system protein CusF